MFKKKILIPLLICVCLAVLLLVLTFTGNKTNEKAKNDTVSSDVNESLGGSILSVDSETISVISVKLKDETFTLTKDADAWKMENNLSVSISSASVNMLSNALSDIKYYDKITDSSIKDEDCGINEESEKITFKCSLGIVDIIKGNVSPDSAYYYIKTNLSEDFYLVDITYVSKIFSPLSSYRNGAFLSVDFDNLSDIVINSDENIVLKKGSADSKNSVYNEWKMLSPIESDARDDEIKSKISEPLKEIKITGFASDNGDFDKFGLGGKNRYISLSDLSGKKQVVYFSRELNGKCYISIGEGITIYEINTEDAPYAFLKPIDIAQRNINLSNIDRLKTVTVQGNENGNYTIEFSSGESNINGKKISKDDTSRVVFQAICGLMADDVYAKSGSGEEIVISYLYTDGTADKLIFSSYNDRYYSVSKNGLTKYLILKTKLDDMFNSIKGLL